ncbi:hypothetical protein [Yinghuangia sp. YIM S09857]|uniref:hypothetical protein n=1 Tax=Yinghuangia sp. YIM S09857 TaxID=3436929 RepID=UPI003F533E09
MSPYSDDRLPAHDFRRRQLMAALDADETRAEGARTSRRVLVPLAATAAVIVASGIGVLAAEPWADGADGTGPTSYRVPGENGVPRESARVGDPVPGDVAAPALATCLKKGAATTQSWAGGDNPPPSGMGVFPTPIGSGPPTGLPTQTKPGPGLSSPPMPGPPVDSGPEAKPSGGSATALLPPPPDGPEGQKPQPLGRLPEKASAYHPVLTSWIDGGDGRIVPFVIGKALGPGIVACVGEPSDSQPLSHYLDQRDPSDLGPRIGDNEFPSLKPGTNPQDPASVGSVTLWGFADPEVARVEVSTSGGPPVRAEVRNGAWAVNGPFPYSVVDDRRVEIRSYDANGTILSQGGRGSR